MDTQLNLLMNFPPWCDGRRTGLDTFMRTFPRWHARGIEYDLYMRHRPRRAGELMDGGSVYCRWATQILWRMPILRFDPAELFKPDCDERWRTHTVVVLSCRIRMVQPLPVRFLRGFRYLEPAAAPPDLPEDSGPAMPGPMVRYLRELGVCI